MIAATGATASTPAWRCACIGCKTLTLQLHCDRHRDEFEQLLDAVLADRRAADTTTAAPAATRPMADERTTA